MIARRIVLALSILGCASLDAQEPPAWPDTYLARVQALAVLQTFNAGLLASRSSTLTLEQWCRDHRLASEPKIEAEVVKDAAKAPSAEQRQRLQVSSQDEVKYRR